MRQYLRELKARFGIMAPRLAVRQEVCWHWRLLGVVALVGIGYGIGYWRATGSDPKQFPTDIKQLQNENKALLEKAVYSERQLQVAHAAQDSLAKEMAGMQDESMRLKEDVVFYKSILVEGTGSGVAKIHSMKVARAGNAGEYQYHILLVQSGKHDKLVQGSLQLEVNGVQSGKPVVFRLNDAQSSLKAGKVSFKYYQRIDGVFSVPVQTKPKTLLARFFEQGATQPKLVQTVNLPG
jgi:hypothetical protein